ncbi:hypothetical protein X726_31670 [Mesorhizobium sp. L103C105A0]|nr:hypothetical protein X726_31670 [Mesorhizobium sp. L103C105A0]
MPAVVSLATGNLVLNWGEGAGKVRSTGEAAADAGSVGCTEGASAALAGSTSPSISFAGSLPA